LLIISTVSFPPFSSISDTITFISLEAYMMAIALPIPELAPVTIATLSLRSFIKKLLFSNKKIYI